MIRLRLEIGLGLGGNLDLQFLWLTASPGKTAVSWPP